MKKKNKIMVFVICTIITILGVSFIGIGIYNIYFSIEDISVKDINFKDNNLTVYFKGVRGNAKCLVTDKKELKDEKWNDIAKNKCKFKLDKNKNYNIYVKRNTKTRKLYVSPKVLYFSIDKKTYYLAKHDKRKISYSYITLGDIKDLFTSSDKSVAYVENNKIISENKGTSKIKVKEFDEEINVIVTDLINKAPKKYNYNREYLSCDKFTLKEEKLLDKILKDRVEEKGYKTRAGVVEAARFLTLEFPYRISYFSENGRLDGGSLIADGEGRFYHNGLYLTSSKYKEIKTVVKGPKPWGCYMYSKPSKGMRRNGLDCSGFTTWVLHNGGFDPGDLPARGKNIEYDLNSIGTEKVLTYELSISKKIKAGDFLGEVSESEGHSAIIVGVDKNYYYVAESLWHSPLGVNINKYKKEDLYKNFETVNLMDSYYKKYGNYSNMWY